MPSKATTAMPTIAALGIALGGPPLLAIVAGRMLSDFPSVAMQAVGQLVLWIFLALVLFVVVRMERLPLASIGLKSPGWLTIVSALLLVLGVLFLLSPVTNWILNELGLHGFEKGISKLSGLPVWLLLFMALTAGVVEETLYRGYAIERLASLTGSYWLGGLIAAVMFGVAHIPNWGLGPALVSDFAFGVVMTLFYLWRRDLLANIIAHVTLLTVELLLLPPAIPG